MCVCVCLCVLVCVCECLCVFVSVCLCGVGVGFTVSVWGVSRFWFGHVRCSRNRPSRDRRWGFTRQPEISKRAHLSAPARQTPPKFHEKTPREGRKERILRREREKKARNFGPPTLRAPTLRTSTFLHPPTSTQNTQKKTEQLISKNPNKKLRKT